MLAFVFTAVALAGGLGFRNQHLLDDHFERYGHEFGRITKSQYLRLAQQLRDTHAGNNILESRRHGTILKFDRKRGYFGAYDPDGTVRTFFIPPEGIRYFQNKVAGGESRE